MKLCTKSIKSYSTIVITNGIKTIKTTINEHDARSVINFSLYIKSELRYNTIMNLNNIEREMSQAVYDRDGGKLNQIYIGLVKRRDELNSWFDMYLDKYGDQFELVEKTNPIRVVYDRKFTEYSNLATTMRHAESYMARNV